MPRALRRTAAARGGIGTTVLEGALDVLRDTLDELMDEAMDKEGGSSPGRKTSGRHRMTLAALLSVTLTMACSADSPTPPDGPLTRQEFIEHGDDACSWSLDRQEDVVHRLTDGRLPDSDAQQRSPRFLLRYLDRLAPVYEDLLEYFQALRPPPDGRGLAQRFTALVRDQVDEMNVARESAERGDSRAYARQPGVLESRRGYPQLARELQRYGFSTCGLGLFDDRP